MKVPTLKVQYEERESGGLSSLSLGLGLHYAWVLAALIGATDTIGLNLAWGMRATSTPIYICSIAVHISVLLAIGVLDQRLLRFLVDRRTTLFAAALMSIGAVLIPLSATNVPIAIFSGIATGTGSAVMLVFWGTAYSRVTQRASITNTAIGFVVAAIGYEALQVAPSPVALACITGSPWIEGVLVWQHTPAPYAERRALPIFNPLPVNKTRFTVLLAIPMLLMGVPLGYLRERMTFFAIEQSHAVTGVAVMGMAAIVVLAVFGVCAALIRSNNPDAIARPVLPFVALGVALCPLASMSQEVIPSALVMTGYLLCEGMIWTILSGLSQQYRLSPVFVFGIGRGFTAMGTLFGRLGVNALFSGSTYDLVPAITVVLAMLVLLVTGFATMPHERDVKRAVVHGSVSQKQTEELASMNMTCPVQGLAEEMAPKTDQRNEAPNSKSAVQKTKEDTVLAAAPHKSSNSADETQHHKGGRFRRKCEAVSNRYLLSSRENEVLFFLARGFNAAYIEKKLFISEGTAKTHIRHIYNKTNVHSQQELIRLIEDTAVEEL